MVYLTLVASLMARAPNIVLFLTDDQDQMLGGSFPPTDPGGATPLPKTKKLLADAGATSMDERAGLMEALMGPLEMAQRVEVAAQLYGVVAPLVHLHPERGDEVTVVL